MGDPKFKDVELERLWHRSGENESLGLYSFQQVLKYTGHKPLSSYSDSAFLFLIGQAGAGKSTYLRNQFASKQDFLFIDLKKLQNQAVPEICKSEKWIAFLKQENTESSIFTLILDAWDELIEEEQQRGDLVKLLLNLEQDLRPKLRIRISCRPDIPEREMLKDLHRDCPWLVKNPEEFETYRVLLSGLCGEQIKSIYTAYPNPKKSEQDFHKWCQEKQVQDFLPHVQTLRFLIDSFLTNNYSWETLPELYEAILGLKIKDDPNRKIDRERTRTRMSIQNRFNALGSLGLYYLFNGRHPIHHKDISSNIFDLPNFENVSPEMIRFLLSTPIFTPGEKEYVHFAQAQEAEFLAARRLNEAQVNLDNLEGLFFHDSFVPNDLHGLCKWLAKFNKDWLNRLCQHFPNLAVGSMDLLVHPEIRSEVIQSWWHSPKSYRFDWDTVFIASRMLKNTNPIWICDEIIKASEKSDTNNLEVLLQLSKDVSLNLDALNAIANFLAKITEDKDLYSESIETLSKNNYGDLDFWNSESLKDNSHRGGRRIPFIITRMEMLGASLTSILTAIQPVGNYSQHFKYTDFLRKFFERQSVETMNNIIDWLSGQEFHHYQEYCWLNGVISAVIKKIIEYRREGDFLTISKKIWAQHSGIQLYFPKDEALNQFITDDFYHRILGKILGSEDNLNVVGYGIYHRDDWLIPDSKFFLVLSAYEEELKTNGKSNLSDAILRFAEWRSQLFCFHLEKLDKCRNILQKSDQFEGSVLHRILGPWEFESEWSSESRKINEDQLKWETRNFNEKIKFKTDQEIAMNSFRIHLDMINDFNWTRCYHLLTFAYQWDKQGNRGFFPLEYLSNDFWYQILSKNIRQILQDKAIEFLHSSEWQEVWTQDFQQRKKEGSFTTNLATAAPLFAWQMLKKLFGMQKFSDLCININRSHWLKYLWSYSCFHHVSYSDEEWLFLLKGESAFQLNDVWEFVKIHFGQEAAIPDNFVNLINDSDTVRKFIDNLFCKPFSISLESNFLRYYLNEINYQKVDHWFQFWKSSISINKKSFKSREFKFFLKLCLPEAWETLINYGDHLDFKELFEFYSLDRHGTSKRGMESWGQELIKRVLEFFYTHFPPELDPVHEGAYNVTWKEEIGSFRNFVLETAMDLPTPEAQKVYRDLSNSIPNFDSRQYIQIHHQKKISQRQRLNFNQKDITQLLESKDMLVIQNDGDFLKWICRIFEDFEQRTLNGENGLSTLLWDEPIPKTSHVKRAQKHEEALSDLLYHWLDWRKQANPIISSREIQIRRKSKRNSSSSDVAKGKIVDIDCRFRSVSKNLRVTVEIKRDINNDWQDKHSLNQLKEYLEIQQRKHGIYVIGRWEGFKLSKSEILDFLRPQVEALQKEEYFIEPFVLEIK